MGIAGLGQPNLKLKLDEVFIESRVSEIINDPQTNQYYANLVFNSYHLELEDPAKFNSLTHPEIEELIIKNKLKEEYKISSIELVNSILVGSFNILLSDLQHDFKQKKYYKLKNTHYVLVLNSLEDLVKQ